MYTDIFLPYSLYERYTPLSISVSPNKDNEGWERKLIQQEPNPIDIFAYEEKNIDFIGQETDPAAPAEVAFIPQVERYVQAMQQLKNFPSPIMVLL